MNTTNKRLGVTEIVPGMRLHWRKRGVTGAEVFIVTRVEKRGRGKTRVFLIGADGRELCNVNAGNRYVPASTR
ncbi:MAG: hypothetical protein ACREIA_15325 [Opitutaceae bacterium]